jgi:Arc/MetJ-type ribon-helix-helix transcriptional regulator
MQVGQGTALTVQWWDRAVILWRTTTANTCRLDAPMATLPSTTAFPPDPSQLDREALDTVYLSLRSSYRSLMVSRGVYRSQSQRSREAMRALEEKLRRIAEREASVRAEAYEMLEIVTGVIGDLEDAGDDLVNEFASYQKGRKTYAGGSYIGRLIQAVIHFISRWRGSKERLEVLLEKQAAMKQQLETGHGPDR